MRKHWRSDSDTSESSAGCFKRSARIRFFASVLIALVTSGCSPHFGYRPDEPVPGKDKETSLTDVCAEYQIYAKYSQDLQESYHTRASQNRAWIYVGGILGLGTVAASGGLAAASAASAGTIALLSISGGFSAGAFATVDNETLASIYTIAANKVDTAMQDAETKLKIDSNGNRFADKPACTTALNALKKGVSDARIALEEARTDSAKAALQRAVAQQQSSQKLIPGIAASNPTVIIQQAAITDINPVSVPGAIPITLTVTPIRLGEVPQNNLKVTVNGQEFPVSSMTNVSGNTWTIVFTTPAGLATGNYDPILLVGENKQQVANTSGKKLQYP